MKKLMVMLCAAALASAAFAEEPAAAAPCGCKDGAECKCSQCECKPGKAQCQMPSCECKKGGECKCAPCECKKPRRDVRRPQRPAAILLDAKTDPAAVEAFKKDVMERIDKAAADAAAEGAAPVRVMLIVNDRGPNQGPRNRPPRGKGPRHGRRGRPDQPQAADGAAPTPQADAK